MRTNPFGIDAAGSIARRAALQIGGAGVLGASLAKLWAAEKQGTQLPIRAKSCIFLYQFGGPSHLETFDMKPGAPEKIRGLYAPIASSAPAIQVCEHLPETAKIMHKVALVRSVHHSMKNHNSASYHALTGHAPPVDDIRLKDSLELFPAYGSVVDRLRPGRADLPSFVALPHVIRDGSVTPGQHASFLGKKYDPLLVTDDPAAADFRLSALTLPKSLTPDRLQHRREMQQLIDSQTRLLETRAGRGMDEFYDRALAMITSPKVRSAFDLAAEKPEVRDRYGRHTYGQSCLLARRLVESGVRFVNVYFSDSIGGQSTTAGGWDTHGFNNTRMFPIIKERHLPITDQTLPALLNDLDDRGLLDDTLVVWMGEFGRTPKINDNISRDHWPHCYTVLLAGGGIKRGAVFGASDKNGAYPDRDPVSLPDLAATIFHALGVDPSIELFDPNQRPLVVAPGRVQSHWFS